MIKDNDPNGARVALCPNCKGLIAVTVNENINKETNKAFAKLMKAGCIIKYISIIEVRKSVFCPSGCPAKKERQKLNNDGC